MQYRSVGWARTRPLANREALVEAMGKALDAITARDARGFFEHCGYRAPVTTIIVAVESIL
jgi:hypothetical protein